jgi:prepilin-type N-terminal cleavage/methylation domain-containing protein
MAAQQGFTLVEMAIVLVIIGLIVGGILKGQEIVANARVKTQVAQIDAVKAAVETFQDKYAYYPGDDPQAYSQLGIDSTFKGNGDGFVSKAAGAADADNATEINGASGEPNMVWWELQSANLIAGVINSAPTAPATASSASYNYEGKIGGSYLTYADLSYAAAAGTVANKYIRISGVANPLGPTPVMREQDANQIDLKYDDDLPSQGQILAASYSNNACCSNGACTATNSAYGLAAGASSAGQYCALLWQAQ